MTLGIGCEHSDWDIERYKAERDSNIQRLNELIIEHRDFMYQFHDITFWKGSLFDNTERIISSVSKTLESIRYCLINVNVADMYTLLRKCRDDLFFFILVKILDEDKVSTNDKEKMKSKIEEWEKNQLKDLNICDVLKHIGQYGPIAAAIKKYGMREEFDNMGNVLNNYVHSNGMIYYNQLYDKYNDVFYKNSKNVLKGILDDFAHTMNYLFVSFFIQYRQTSRNIIR